jgi:hypothetical protein
MTTKGEELSKFKAISEATVEEIAFMNENLCCEECGVEMTEGVSLTITMGKHDEGTVETGPIGPAVWILCNTCQKEFDEIAKQQGGYNE